MQCLKRFGLENFVPIFRVLYKELRSDILVNGKIVKGFEIKRGVKQGDALSCILFIMSIEPLLRNIEANPVVEKLVTRQLALPKVYAYADDINCAVKNNKHAVQAIFNEYSRLTNLSGLTLNADKTEVKRIKAQQEGLQAVTHKISYLNNEVDLTVKPCIKINGILFQQDSQRMKDRNVAGVLEKIDSIFKHWSWRNLSLLGKVLIVKTFGISQLIYLFQSIVIDACHFKK